jgi:hypothetical protein
MLGRHEVDSFRLRIESIKQAKHERIVSFQGAASLPDEGAGDGNSKGRGLDKGTMVKNRIRERLHEKKVSKVMHLKGKGKNRQYKKFMLVKRYQEDEDEEGSMGLSKHQKEIRAQMMTKFTALYMRQQEEENVKSTLEGGSKLEEAKVELLSDVIANIKEEYFSDLCPGDIPDDEVSDVDESEIDVDQIQKQLQTATLNAQIKAQEEIIDRYSQENLEFMTYLSKCLPLTPSRPRHSITCPNSSRM